MENKLDVVGLASRVLQFEEQLLHLRRQVEEQTSRSHQMNESILGRLERLETRYGPENAYGVQRLGHSSFPSEALRVHEVSPLVKSGVSRAGDPEKVAFELLDLIEPAGRAAPLARLPELIEWLTKNHPGIEAEAIGELNRDLWLLLVLTADGNTGVVVPALDSIIGPGEVRRWFEGGRYDGTQALVRANVWSLGKAVCDAETRKWQPSVKGRINLT